MNNEKISIDTLSGVPRTLLIPLSGRSLAREKFPEYGFKDELAEEILKKINFDINEFAFDEMSMKGSISRAQIIDNKAKDFFAKNPSALGISLGTGLCTRFWRVDNGTMKWLDVDFKEVIDLREKLLPANDRHYSLAASLLTDEWMKKAKELSSGPWFISIEGVLMYLRTIDVESFFKMVGLYAPNGSEIVFDYTNPLLISLKIKPRAVLSSGTSFNWGLKKPERVQNISRRFHLIGSPDRFVVGKIHSALNKVASFILGGEVYALAHYKIND